MKAPLKPTNEKLRLEALRSYNILDTLPEKEYDEITRIAAEICDVPISMLTLIDSDRQWFKSTRGMNLIETERNLGVCAHAINDPGNMMEISDARKDVRFYDNPFMTGDPAVVFYAGVPLVDNKGCALGTLCVVDHKPRKLSAFQKRGLTALADQVMRLLDLRLEYEKLRQRESDLQIRYNELEKFTYVVSHDLKSPLNNILSLSNMLLESSDMENNGQLQIIHESAETLRSLVDGILKYYKSDIQFSDQREPFDVKKLIHNVINLYQGADQIDFTMEVESKTICTHRTALKQILINLIGNAIKYNDESVIRIGISMTETDEHYIFQVSDNGRGIALKDQNKIFDLFTTLGPKDRKHQNGSGIGLATVKKLVNQLGGEIQLHSVLHKGTRFEFTLRKTAGGEVILPDPCIEQHIPQ